MVRQQIQAAVVAAVQATRDLGSSALPAPPAVAVEVALGTQPGDYFTDVAIQWAAMAPLEARPLAERILAHLTAPSDLVARAEATESGRLCFHLQPQVLEAAVAAALAQGSAYGRSDAGRAIATGGVRQRQSQCAAADPPRSGCRPRRRAGHAAGVERLARHPRVLHQRRGDRRPVAAIGAVAYARYRQLLGA